MDRVRRILVNLNETRKIHFSLFRISIHEDMKIHKIHFFNFKYPSGIQKSKYPIYFEKNSQIYIHSLIYRKFVTKFFK